MGKIDGRIVLVTGASRGIGAAIARRMAAEGGTVIATARTASGKGRFHDGQEIAGSLDETVREIEAAGGTAVGLPCDVGDPRSRAALAKAVLDRFGRVDILINNAAGTRSNITYDRVSEDDYNWMWELNFRGPLDFIQRFAPEMSARGWGRIVNVTSRAAELPKGPPFSPLERSGMMLYGCVKAALNRMTIAVAAELEGSGVSANALAPFSVVWTPGAAAAGLEQYRSLPGWREEPPEAMAEATLALCLADPALVTGRVVYSTDYLAEIGQHIHTLDGRQVLREWRPAIA